MTVICEADKGRSVVFNKEDYKVEALRQLSDTSTYRTLSSDPTQVFKHKLIHLLDRRQEMGVLTKKVAEYLLVDYPIIRFFHHLPKIHKDDIPTKGRLIVASIGFLLEKLREWVDQYLQPLVTRLPGYVKDTASILRHSCNIHWQDSFSLVT